MLQTDALKILEGISINRAPIMKAKKEKHKRNSKHNNKQVTYQQGNNNPSSKLIMINFILDILEILVQAAVFENDQDGDDDKITSA